MDDDGAWHRQKGDFPPSMRQEQRHVPSFHELFGEAPDKEFFQKMAGVDPEDDEIGVRAGGGAEEFVEDIFHGSFTGVAHHPAEPVGTEEEFGVAEKKVGLLFRDSGRDEDDLGLEDAR